MKTYLHIAFAAACVLLLNACANIGGGGPTTIAGTWVNSLGTIWTLNPDGTFEVDRNHDGTVDIRGTYTIKGDTLTIERNTGKVPKGCKGPGVYKYSRKADSLMFTLVSDTCSDRKKNVLNPWHKK